MDKAVIRAFSRAAETYDENSKPQQELWQELLSLLEPFDQNYKAILDIGMGTGKNTYELTKVYPQSCVVGFDIAEGMVDYARKNWVITDNQPIFLQADLEAAPFKTNSFDLVISNAVFQRIGNLEGAFSQINKILRPDGIFCLSLFTDKTLLELRNSFIEAYINIEGLSPTSCIEHHTSIRIIESLKSDGFDIIQQIDFEKKQYFKNSEEIIIWLKSIGATHHFRNWMNGINGRRVLEEMDKIYKVKYSVDSGIYATFDGLVIKAEKL